jgi:hypothetical protein
VTPRHHNDLATSNLTPAAIVDGTSEIRIYVAILNGIVEFSLHGRH